jgi:hypothetical protein
MTSQTILRGCAGRQGPGMGSCGPGQSSRAKCLSISTAAGTKPQAARAWTLRPAAARAKKARASRTRTERAGVVRPAWTSVRRMPGLPTAPRAARKTPPLGLHPPHQKPGSELPGHSARRAAEAPGVPQDAAELGWRRRHHPLFPPSALKAALIVLRCTCSGKFRQFPPGGMRAYTSHFRLLSGWMGPSSLISASAGVRAAGRLTPFRPSRPHEN